jgi:hypothetical protein
MPAGLVAFMREQLHWDVFFVMEHDDLRRARDDEHYRLAKQLRRTLVTLDRDYFDDRRFPPAEGSGVIIISGADERVLANVLRQVDRALFRVSEAASETLPLSGRKLDAYPGWPEST